MIAGDPGASLMKWALGIRQAPDALDALAGHYEKLAATAVDHQPLSASLRTSIQTAATRCRTAYDIAAGWYPTLREQNAADFAAYENPRDGSLTKETRTDVDQADAAGITYAGRHHHDDPPPPPPPAPARAGARRPRLRDALKLTARTYIPLRPGEKIIGSSKVDGMSGNVRIAVTDTDGTRTIRLGVGGETFGTRDAAPWDAGPDRTATLDADQAAVRAECDRIEAQLTEMLDDPDHDPRAAEALERRGEQLLEQLSADATQAGYTAALDVDTARRIRADLQTGLDQATADNNVISRYWDAVARAEKQLDKIRDDYAKRVGPGRGLPGYVPPAGVQPWTDADDQRFEDLYRKVEDMKANAPEHDYRVYVTGQQPAEWGTVSYRVELDDPTCGPQALIGVVPGAGDGTVDDLLGLDEAATLDQAETTKLIRQLDQAIDGEPD